MFHKKLRQYFENVEEVETYVDDILIWGSNEREHDLRLEKVLEIARRNNIKFNLNKCKLRTNAVNYMGHIITEKGLKINSGKVQAVVDMPRPIDEKGIERFLGVVNYLNRYIPNFSVETEPLRELIRKENLFSWTEKQENAFKTLKSKLIKAPVLQYYNKNEPVLVTCDALKNGCGSVIMQNQMPIAYASKAFTQTQKAYAQIEKEMLAIVFACVKFHQYIYAKNNVVIETDHKPLISIYNKPLTMAPARLQRMLIMLQQYTFELRYKKGKELIIADTLSGLF